MTNILSVYLYFIKELPEPDTWDNKFSYFFRMILSQILDSDLKIYSNQDVSGTRLSNVKNLETCEIDAVVIIQNQITNQNYDLSSLADLNVVLNRLQDQNVFHIIKNGRLNQHNNTTDSRFSQYRFFEMNQRTFEMINYNPDVPGDSENGFWEKISDLAYDIRMAATQNANNFARENTIYLAEVSNDQVKNRDKIRRELLLLGYKVIPFSPLPRKSEDFENTVTSLLKESILSVNIMGETYGESPQLVDYSYVELQNRLFEKELTLQKKSTIDPKIHRIIWTQPIIEFYDEKQTQYVKRIQSNPLNTVNSEFVQSNVTELVDIIQKRIKKIKTEGFEFIAEEHKSNLMVIWDEEQTDLKTILGEKLSGADLDYQSFDLNGIESAGTEALLSEFKIHNNFLVINAIKSESWITSLLALIIRSKGLPDAIPFDSLSVLSIHEELTYKNLTPVDLKVLPFKPYKFDELLDTLISKIKT